MRISCCFCLFVLAMCTAMGRGQEDQQNRPTKTTLCVLAEQPEQYAGKMVAVRAKEMGKDFWIEDFANTSCSAWTQVIVVYPDQINPVPGFNLVRDDAFRKFFEEIQKGNTVEATYVGRFDVAFVWRDHKRISVGTDKGYGKKQKYGARLVLQSISEVVARPRYHR
jgi:hypothetical protein